MVGIHFSCLLGEFDTCLVWYLLVLPSETHAVADMTSLRAIDGDTSYHSRESFSLCQVKRGTQWKRASLRDAIDFKIKLGLIRSN